MFITMGAIDKAAHMWGAQADNRAAGLQHAGRQTHVRCAAENADVQLGKILAAIKQVDAAKGGHTLVVLTADHGATYGEHFYGKTSSGGGDSNWYYAPSNLGVWDAGSAGALDTVTYSNPSPDIAATERRRQRAVLLPVHRDRGVAARPVDVRQEGQGGAAARPARRDRDVLEERRR
jgi:hypothetical protein